MERIRADVRREFHSELEGRGSHIGELQMLYEQSQEDLRRRDHEVPHTLIPNSSPPD